jgi:hypothetical protein
VSRCGREVEGGEGEGVARSCRVKQVEGKENIKGGSGGTFLTDRERKGGGSLARRHVGTGSGEARPATTTAGARHRPESVGCGRSKTGEGEPLTVAAARHSSGRVVKRV